MGFVGNKAVFGCFMVCLFYLAIGCEANPKKVAHNRLKGTWFIEEIKYNDHSYYDYLDSNVLVLEEKDEISIPETYHFEKDKNATWHLLNYKNNILLNINSSNLAFKDTFSIRFIDDDSKGKGMILESDSIYIKAFKFLLNPDDWN